MEELTLPDDIIEAIFSHLSPREIIQRERVCQQWRRVAWSSPALFYDGLAQGEDMRIDVHEHRLRVEALAKRNGGRFTDLALSFNLDAEYRDDVTFICDLLPTSGVQNLWIEMSLSQCRSTDDLDGIVGVFNQRLRDIVALPKYREMAQEIYDALFRCGNLRSLHFARNDVDDLFAPPVFAEGHDLPISCCSFERLMLHTSNGTKLFATDYIYQATKNAKIIEILAHSRSYQERHFWRMLWHAGPGLQEIAAKVSVEPPNEIRHALATFGMITATITLPCLTRLDLTTFESHTGTTSSAYRLHCPNLAELRLTSNNTVPTEILEDLLTPTIKVLHLAIDLSNRNRVNLDFLLRLLRRCTALQDFRHDVDKYMTDYGSLRVLWKAFRNELARVPLSSLTVVRSWGFLPQEADELISMVEARSQGTIGMSPCTKIQRLTLIDGKGDMIDWPSVRTRIEPHVEFFRLLDRSRDEPTLQQMYRQRLTLLSRRCKRDEQMLPCPKIEVWND